jgi:uncharacterized RDD family membrane protein YckC
MICPQCGTNVPDTARFCPKCGSSFAAAAPPGPPPDQQPTVPAAPVPPQQPPYTAPQPYVTPTVAMPPMAPPPYQPAASMPPVAPPAGPYAAQQPPYQPQAPAAASAYTLFASYPVAGLGGRLGAYVLDILVASLLYLPALAMTIVALARGGGEISPVVAVIAPILYVLGGLWALLYYIIKDGLKGASFGRRIVGETVVSLKTGAPATVGQSFLRNLILGLLSWIDGIVLLVDKQHRRLGDKAASTQVVPTKDFVAMTGGACVPPGKGLAVTMVVLPFVLLVVGVFVGFVLGGAPPSSAVSKTGTIPPSTSSSTKPTGSDADSVAVQAAVKEFYDNINGGDLEKVGSILTDDAKAGIDPGAFQSWQPTTWEFARSVVDGTTAYVYGREHPRELGGETGGVKFTLTKVSGTWLIATWNAVDEATVNGVQSSSGQGTGATTLDETSARDIVTKLLQARQKGDANAIRSLTTAKFQTDNGDVWLDGIDNSPYFTSFTIQSATQSGSAWTVTASEAWNSGAETGTYTVIDQSGTILVDSWSSASQ